MCAFVRVRCQGREIQSHSANMIYNCKQTVHNCSNHFSNHSWSCWTARTIKWLSILEESRAVPSMRSKIHDNAQRRIDVRQPIDSTISRSCSSTSVTSASQSTTHMKSACLYSVNTNISFTVGCLEPLKLHVRYVFRFWLFSHCRSLFQNPKQSTHTLWGFENAICKKSWTASRNVV